MFDNVGGGDGGGGAFRCDLDDVLVWIDDCPGVVLIFVWF